jgi:hypothetical protein
MVLHMDSIRAGLPHLSTTHVTSATMLQKGFGTGCPRELGGLRYPSALWNLWLEPLPSGTLARGKSAAFRGLQGQVLPLTPALLVLMLPCAKGAAQLAG